MRAGPVVRCSVAAVAYVLALLVLTPNAAHPSASETKDNLYGVSFPTARDGWIVGSFGTVLHSNDGGESWNAQSSGTVEHLYGIDFVDPEHGWIVGRSGLVLHTTDGGKTWAPQASQTDKHLFSIDFVDRQFGCAVGDWGAVVVTQDGGATWRSLPLSDDIILNDVTLLDHSKGWIAGELGSILATEDGGQTWNRLDSGLDKTLFGIFFADALRGWVVGIDALILHTTDGGATWTVQNGSTEVRALEQVGFSQAYDNPSLYAVSVLGDVGFVSGEIGAVFQSDDGGQTWSRRDVAGAEGSWLRDLSVAAGGQGVIVGAEGLRVRIVGGQLEKRGE